MLQCGLEHAYIGRNSFLRRKLDPCLAFQRRPQLRYHVHDVTFSPSDHFDFVRPESVPYICQQLGSLPMVKRIKWCRSSGGHPMHVRAAVFEPIVQALSRLQTLRELQLPFIISPPSDYLNSITQPLSDISLIFGNVSFPFEQWLQQQQRDELHQLDITIFATKMILSEGFHALRSFAFTPVLDLFHTLATIQGMPCIKDLVLGIRTEVWDIYSAVM
ncbi:hypothetical protein M408DRAFT_159162 [Serendipita vermifera MAFF 305830]|uniref:Uncharacterized protein n=1 Tax=Serendipita vermifera MAFF 305830 TaxID=933852 RepID=A0A0C3AT88_SERVB|nr:hypothetical protein M408DRAFT_159162 [Serendipita vermifera MAFF 305830]